MAEPSERDKRRARGICGCYRHEEIARAIASAREEADAAGFERGRRAGMEEAAGACAAARDRVLAMARERQWSPETRTALKGDAEMWGLAADAIRALIGGSNG